MKYYPEKSILIPVDDISSYSPSTLLLSEEEYTRLVYTKWSEKSCSVCLKVEVNPNVRAYYESCRGLGRQNDRLCEECRDAFFNPGLFKFFEPAEGELHDPNLFGTEVFVQSLNQNYSVSQQDDVDYAAQITSAQIPPNMIYDNFDFNEDTVYDGQAVYDEDDDAKESRRKEEEFQRAVERSGVNYDSKRKFYIPRIKNPICPTCSITSLWLRMMDVNSRCPEYCQLCERELTRSELMIYPAVDVCSKGLSYYDTGDGKSKESELAFKCRYHMLCAPCHQSVVEQKKTEKNKFKCKICEKHPKLKFHDHALFTTSGVTRQTPNQDMLELFHLTKPKDPVYMECEHCKEQKVDVNISHLFNETCDTCTERNAIIYGKKASEAKYKHRHFVCTKCAKQLKGKKLDVLHQ